MTLAEDVFMSKRQDDHFYEVTAAIRPGQKAFAPDLIAPPKEWFTDLPEWWNDVQQHSIWVDDEGRVAGLIANFSQCYLNYGEACITPWEVKEDEKFVYQGNVAASLGEKIPVAIMAATKGHNFDPDRDPRKITLANQGFLDDNFQPLTNSDDVMRHQLVYGRYKNTPEGIAFLGAVFPHVTEDMVHSIRVSAVSPHWIYDRTEDEMIFTGAVFVNRPALPLSNHSNLELREIAASLRYTHIMAEAVDSCTCNKMDVVAATDPNLQGVSDVSEDSKPELTNEERDAALLELTRRLDLVETELMNLIKAQDRIGEGVTD